MTKSKKRMVSTLAILAAIVFLLCAAVDFTRFFGFTRLYHAFPSDYVKRAGVILSAVIVWMAGKDSYSLKDNRHMKKVFLIICLGESAFLLREPVVAVGLFAVCQSLLILRNGKGLKSGLTHAGLKQRALLMLSALTLTAILALTAAALYPAVGSAALLFISCIYGVLISTSLWVGLSSYVLKLFPATNSKMIAVGMACFYCCDILVGLDFILSSGMAWLLANSFIWVFYTPAVVLLALSCYKYE